MRDLGGRRVLVTRSAAGCRSWARGIEAARGRAVQLPCIRTELLDTAAVRAALQSAVRDAAWLTVSSPRGAQAVATMLAELPDGIEIAAVGPTTAAACEELLGPVSLTAPAGTASSMAGALLGRLPFPEASPVVTVAAVDGRHDLEQALQRAGVPVRRVEVYRTVWEPDDDAERRPLAGEVDVVLLASPSAVHGLLARAEIDGTIDVITIGPSTSAAARESGLRVTAEASERTLNGMLEAIP